MTLAASARAGCVEHPLSELGPRLARLAEPTQVALLGSAAVAPLVIAPTGGDWNARLFYYRDLGARYDQERISLTAPYALGAAVFVGWSASAIAGDCSRVANRALQAVAFAAAIQAVLKLAVGRVYPASDPAHQLVDDGRAFRAAPFATGLGAWPSGHAATTFAFAAAVRASLPRSAGIFRYGSYVLATAVSAGMLLSDHHWTSDIVSGAFLGEAIGRSFGGESDDGVTIVPTAGGAMLGGRF